MSDDARAEKGGKSGGVEVRHLTHRWPEKEGERKPCLAGHVLQNVMHLGPMIWAAECGGPVADGCDAAAGLCQGAEGGGMSVTAHIDPLPSQSLAELVQKVANLEAANMALVAKLAQVQPATASLGSVAVCAICDIAGCHHIRALPAHVQPAPMAVEVKPLQWFEAQLPSRGGGKHTADGYTIRKIEGLWLLDFAGEGKSKWRWVELEAAKAAAQADYEARILSAVNLRPVAEAQAWAKAEFPDFAA